MDSIYEKRNNTSSTTPWDTKHDWILALVQVITCSIDIKRRNWRITIFT